MVEEYEAVGAFQGLKVYVSDELEVKRAIPLATYVWGQGPVSLVILHGLLGSATDWMAIARRLAPRWRVVLLDLPNHGRSPWTADMSYATMAELVLESIPTGESPLVLLGHSLGGRLAMYLADNFSQEFQGLVVVDIGPGDYPEVHTQLLENLQGINLKQSSRRHIRQHLAKVVSEPQWRDFLIKNLVPAEEGGFKWRTNLPAIRHSYSVLMKALPWRAGFKGSVMVIRGVNSPYLPEPQIELLRERYPGMQLVEIRAGHWLQWERPDEVVEELGKFLTQVAYDSY